MATVTKKKRFKEAEFIDQNETQAQPVPATGDEMAQAAPVEAAPAEDDAVLPEGTDGAVEGGVEVNPETVSVQVQIPVDQLGAAVAQATGDLEVANLSPDVESAQEAELVSDGSTGDGEAVPVEGATEEAPTDMSGAEGVEPQLESKKSEGEKLTEDVFTDNSETKGEDDYGKGDSSDEDYQAGKDTAEKHEQPRMDMIDHAIKAEGDTLQESEEPDVVPTDNVDDLPPGMEGEDVDVDIDALGGDVDGPEFASSSEFDVEIDENDPAVQDFLSKIDDYLADEEAQPAQVADALRASADFFDAINPEEEGDEDLLDVEEGEDEGEIDLDLDAIIGYKGEGGHAKTGDEVLDQFASLPDDREEDYEESLVRVPCKFPKKRFGESKAAQKVAEKPLVKMKEVRNDFEHTFHVYDIEWDCEDEYLPYEEDIAIDMADCDDAHGPIDEIMEKLEDQYGCRVYSVSLDDTDERFIQHWAADQGYLDESEQKPRKVRKLHEANDYSGVKFPAGSSAEDAENLVEAHERIQASRRRAIKNFRESVIRDDENRSTRRPSSRFNEALRSSVRMNSRNSNSGSWADNKFLDKYNESQELDFKKLISEGFLG